MSIREALYRFYDLHQKYKAGGITGGEMLKLYEEERDAFMAAFVQAQQLGLRPGQSPRQNLRVAHTERLTVSIGPRKETTVTLDLGVGGFAAQVGPLAARVSCEFELGSAPESVKGRARVVASARQPDGTCRTSFSIDSIAPEDRKKLEMWVLDPPLKAVARR